MDTHAHTPEAPERSHPLLWTAGLLFITIVLIAWFAHFYRSGVAHGRELGMIPSTASEPKGPGEPDHLALIANKGPDVLDRGATVWGKNCATCHGPQGHSNPANMNPPPRNFWTDAFKNPNGGGPYGLYTVLTNGYAGRMPGFPTLSPEDRYAVAHYLRESFVKPNNAKNYLEADSKELLAKLPKPGEGSGAEPIPPKQQPVPKEVFPLMQGVSTASGAEAAAAAAWLARAIDGSEGAVNSALVAIDRHWSGDSSAGIRPIATEALVSLSRAIAAGQLDEAKAMLMHPAPGAFVPEIGLLSSSDFDALIAQLRKAAPAVKSAAGVN